MGVTVPSCTGNGEAILHPGYTLSRAWHSFLGHAPPSTSLYSPPLMHASWLTRASLAGTAEGSSASDLAGGRRPAAMNGSPGGRKASLEELQAKLWSVQQQLMAVIQQQQQLQQQSPSETGSSGDMPSASGLGPDRKTAEEEKQRQLQQLQEELKDVQEQLQRVQKGSPNRGASPQPGPADHPGSLQGSRAAQSPLSHRSGATPGPPQSGANAPSPGAPQGGASTPSPGASSSGQGPRKRASGAPPRRAMVHHEEPQGTAGPSAGSGAGKAGVTRHKAQMQQQEHVQPLRCCLMSLSLPWDLLAFDLLFKVHPQLSLIHGATLKHASPGSPRVLTQLP